MVAKQYFGIELYFTQSLIVGAVLNPNITEICIITPTRYGKTFCFGIASEIAAAVQNLEVQIGGADKEKAKIAMKKITKLIPMASSVITNTLAGGDKFQSVATALSQTRLQWYDGGSIDIFSLSDRVKNTDVAGQGGVGIGGDIILLDESALIADENYSVARRILAEKPNTKLVEISNPHRANHFKRTMEDDKVFRIWINENTVLEEGRMNAEKLERAKQGMTTKEIKIFFRCEFPAENEFSYFKPQKFDKIPPYNELRFYGACDPALGRSGKQGSLVGIVVLAKDMQGKIYEIESIGEVLTPEQTMNRIVSLPYRFERFGIEAIQFQRYFYNEIEKKSMAEKKYIPLVPLQQERKKEERIESLEPYINTGQILFTGRGELWDEMQNYPKSDKLDVLDTLEMAWRLARGGGSDTVSSDEDRFSIDDFI